MKPLLPTLALLLISAVSSLAQIGSTAPIAEYNFTGNANDVSGNGYNGVVTNATLTTDRFGNANSAYYFNAALPGKIVAAIPNIPVGWAYRSINAWTKWSGVPYVNAAHIVNWGPSTDGNAFGEMIYLNHTWYGYGYNEPMGYDLPTNMVADTQWHMLTYTYGGENGMLRFWVDGHLKAQRVTTLNTIKTDLYIGARPDESSDCNFTGKIDDIGIYDYELDSVTINSLYTGTPLATRAVTGNTHYSIYPNPAEDYIQIEGVKEGTAVRIYDMTGRMVMNTVMGSNKTIDLSAVQATGVYQVQIISDGKLVSEKLVKE